MNLKLISIALALTLIGCDGGTGPRGDSGNVSIQFETTSASQVSANVQAADGARLAADELTLAGTNGTLVIEDIRFIVSELELNSSDETLCGRDDDDDDGEDEGDLEIGGDHDVRIGSTENVRLDDDDCEFEGGPFIVDLPLNGTASITTENVPAGTYDAFEFEIENLDIDDDDDDGELARLPALLTEMRSAFPNFPSGASMVVKGKQNGQPFVVYFRSEIEIESRLDPPLVVPGDEVLTVKLDPSRWFKNGTQVVNLLALDGRLVELGSAFKNGFSGARHDGD